MLGRAMLVQIFITQIFIFVESSFGAITGLLLAILLLNTVRYQALGDTAPGGRRVVKPVVRSRAANLSGADRHRGQLRLIA